MANPFEVRVPNVFEALMAGQQGYRSMRDISRQQAMDTARQEAGQALAGGGDTRSALARLIGIGDMQGANALANFGNQGFDQNYKSEMLKLAQQQAQRREEPEDIRKLRATGIDPRSPQGQKLLYPKTDTPISATDKREVFKAEDEIPALQGTIETLKRAKELNPQTFSGAGASMRAAVGSSLPDLMVPDFVADKAGSDATTEWKKLMSSEAIRSMADSLKGATTDFELKKFESMLADPATPPKVREAMIIRMMTLAERQMQLKQDRIRNLRGGEYFKPGSSPAGTQSDPLAAARDAIARGADRNAVMQRLQQNGINPAGL
jgi:hypothetical protein